MKNFIYFLLIPILIFCSSCSRTIIIETNNIQGLEVGSPLSSIKPFYFHVKYFSDVRGKAPTFVGKYVHEYFTDIPVSEVIRNEIIKEISRNGHSQKENENTKEPILIIEGTVYQYWLTFDAGFTTVDVIGNVGMKINIHFSNNVDDIFSKKYEGSYSSGGMAITNDTIIEILNTALRNMMSDFTTDEELMDFISTKRI